MWDWLIVGLIVAAAVFWLGRRFWRMGRSTSPSCGCSGCGGGEGCSGAGGGNKTGPGCGC